MFTPVAIKNPPQLLRTLLCVAFALLAGGCTTATNALWQRQAYHPAQWPLVRLALDPHRQDILVRYNEQIDYSSYVQERAYWLFASTNSPTMPGAPVFLEDSDLASLKDLVKVPVYYSKRDLRQSSAAGYAALTGPGARDFELWFDGKKTRTYKLPAYSEHAAATAWRIALTPGAVTADAAANIAIVTGYLAVYVGPYVLQAYANHH